MTVDDFLGILERWW